MKMACAIYAKEILDQKNHVISKRVRLFYNKKFLLSKFKNYLPKVKRICLPTLNRTVLAVALRLILL